MIIGGSGFFGQYAIDQFKQEGYRVAVADLTEPEASMADHFYHMDATDEASVAAVVSQLEADDVQVSHTINFVGGLEESGLTDIFKTSVEEIQRTINKNLLAQIIPVKILAPHLANADGDKSITFMSSINAHAGWSIPYYSAAKAGIEGFMRPAAMDLGQYGIRLNAVASGSVVTPSTEQQPKNFEARADAAALRRLAEPTDIADAFVACVRLKAMTGQTLVVDCGQSINPSESLYNQHRRMALD